MQKELRLKKNQDFQKVFRNGSSVANRQLVLYVSRNPEVAHFRLGISISKKIGHAVIRNQIKRKLKEVARLHAKYIPIGVDLILIVRKPTVGLSFEDLSGSFIHLLKRAKLFKT